MRLLLPTRASPLYSKLALGASTLLFLLASACSPDGRDITAYPMLCEGPVARQKCTGKATPLNRETFRVYAATQQVVSWLPGVRETPLALEGCAVRDARNWKCRLPRNEGEVGFFEGAYFEVLRVPRPSGLFHASATQWWWHHLVASRL